MGGGGGGGGGGGVEGGETNQWSQLEVAGIPFFFFCVSPRFVDQTIV